MRALCLIALTGLASSRQVFRLAKVGITPFAKCGAKEYGPAGITATVVEPGMVETELSRAPPEDIA